jgi:nitronate monooxygenase
MRPAINKGRHEMTMTTSFTELTGCALPIQQAPMGTVSSPDLAVAVADAGGVGTITALGMGAEQLGGLLQAMSARTAGVLAANFLTREVDRDALAAAAERVRLIDFFWSDPDPSLVELVHAHGALACWQVGSLAEARAAAEAGCDVVVVQGQEAGGHVRGRSPLLPLLSAVLDELHVPVLAAGGISDGRSLAAVLAAGAAGARVGTRFIATDESGAHPLYKQAVIDASLDSTEISDSFAVCPLCATSPRARVLRSCVHALQALHGETVGETSWGDEAFPVPRGSGMPPGASATGHVDAMAMYASDSVASIHAVEPAGHVVKTLCETADSLR